MSSKLRKPGRRGRFKLGLYGGYLSVATVLLNAFSRFRMVGLVLLDWEFTPAGQSGSFQGDFSLS